LSLPQKYDVKLLSSELTLLLLTGWWAGAAAR